MNTKEGLEVRFKSSRTNFVELPFELSNQLSSLPIPSNNIIVELSWKPPRTNAVQYEYAGWSGLPSSGENIIEMDPEFAKAMNIREKQKIDISIEFEIPTAKTIEIEPLTSDDWDFVDLHAGALETQILQQTRGMREGGNIVIYASDTLAANCKVLKISPNPQNKSKFARIIADTEIHVAPKVRRSVQKKKPQSVRSVSSSRRTSENNPFILSKAISLPHPLLDDKALSTYEVYANFDEIIYTLEKAEYVNVSVIPGPDKQAPAPKKDKDSNAQQEEPKSPTKIVAKLIHDPNATKFIGLSRMLAIALDVSDLVGYTVKIEKTSKQNYSKIPGFLLSPIITESVSNEGLLSNAVANKHKEEQRKKMTSIKEQFIKSFNELNLNNAVLTNGVKIPKIQGLTEGGFLTFNDSTKWILPTGSNQVSIEIGKDVLIPKSLSPANLIPEPNFSEQQYPIGQNELIKKITRTLKKGKVGSLVYGASGSGKTLIINQLSQNFHDKGFHIQKIECNDFARESYQVIKEKITSWLNIACWYNPSVLILEGLENLFPVEGEMGGDTSQTRQLSEFFIQAINKSLKNKNIIVLATARSKEAVNSLLFSSHCIEETFNIRAPNKDVRQSIIEDYLNKFGLNFSKEFDASEMSSETEGYLPSDLKVLVDRIYHETIYASIEDNQQVKTVTNELFNTAIKDYVPSNLRGVKLQKSSTSWSDIGGLTEAKSILLETLEWPTKYAPIFKSATLRLRSGILLYGYPGCGKTLLASAVAGQCGLNFISVKGPEILNKYIGASEQSVRELFERAQAAKPCILFFDEFDSIAPKRGHDSTGVTDRVVNQMLTQMDGAEGLDGVYVLAATSRPDLIDSALLRPGRLDKSVICDMPNYEDRLDILRSITRKMLLSKDVSLEEVARESEGFSGADLQALGYNAYLQAVHEKLDNDKLSNEDELKVSDQTIQEFYQVSLNQLKSNNVLKPHDRTKIQRQLETLFKGLAETGVEEIDDDQKTQVKDNGVYIKHKDFISSLKDTKPSISVSEKTKLANIYNKFISARDGNLQDGTPSNEIGARSTLM